MRLGPFYMTPQFELRNLGVDTNVFNTPTATRQSDFTFTAQPRTDIWVPFGRRAVFTTSAGVGFVYFKKFSSERSVDPDVALRLDIAARRVTFFVQELYVNTRQRPNLEIDARSRNTSSTPTAGAAIKVGARVTAEVAVYQNRIRFDQDASFLGTNLSQTLDRSEIGVRGLIRTKLTSFTTWNVRAESQRERFAHTPDRDGDGFRLSSGFDFSPRALIAGTVDVGVRRLANKSAALADFTGVVARTSVTYTLKKTTQFGFSWDRDLNYSFQVDQPYYLANALGFRVRRQLRGRADASFGANRSVYNYRTFSSAPTTSAARRDVTISWSADLGYRLNRDTRLSLGVTTMERTTESLALGNYGGTRAGVSIVYRLPV